MKKSIKRIAALMAICGVMLCSVGKAEAKTATYGGKTVTYTYEMGMVPYGSTNYLEVCTAKMTYPKSISMKITGKIKATKNGKTYSMKDSVSKKTDWLSLNLAFESPGYDIIHFKGEYTIDNNKTYTIDKDI